MNLVPEYRTLHRNGFAIFEVVVTASVLKMDALCVSEISVNTSIAAAAAATAITITTRRHSIPEYGKGIGEIVPVHAVSAYDGVEI